MLLYYIISLVECLSFLVFDVVFVSLTHLILLEYLLVFISIYPVEMEGSCFFLWRCCIGHDAMAHYRYDR